MCLMGSFQVTTYVEGYGMDIDKISADRRDGRIDLMLILGSVSVMEESVCSLANFRINQVTSFYTAMSAVLTARTQLSSIAERLISAAPPEPYESARPTKSTSIILSNTAASPDVYVHRLP